MRRRPVLTPVFGGALVKFDPNPSRAVTFAHANLRFCLVADLAADFYAHPSAVLDAGCRVGAGSRIWHFCHVAAGAVLGENCSLGQNVFVADGVTLGRNVKVQNNVSLYDGVTCEDDVFLGPSVVFTNVKNPRSAVPRRGADHYQPTYLERGVSIGANATIVCGVHLGRYAFVGAGSVVTSDVPAFALVYGTPARQHGWASTYGHRLDFDETGHATCPESGEQYHLGADQTTVTLIDEALIASRINS